MLLKPLSQIHRAPYDFPHPVACRGFWRPYGSLTIFSSIAFVVTYSTAPGRCPVKICGVKSQGAPQQTAGTRPVCSGLRPIMWCIARRPADARPVPGRADSRPPCGGRTGNFNIERTPDGDRPVSYKSPGTLEGPVRYPQDSRTAPLKTARRP